MTLTQHQPVRNPRKAPGSEGSKNYDGAAARASQVLPRLIAPVALAGILLTFSLLSPNFLVPGNLLSVLSQMAILALVAVRLLLRVQRNGPGLPRGSKPPPLKPRE